MRGKRTIAAGVIGAAVTSATLVLGAGAAYAATDIGRACPDLWSGTRFSIPLDVTDPTGKGTTDIALVTGNASNPDGTGGCVAVNTTAGDILELGIANPPGGGFLFYNSFLLGGQTQTVPIP